MTTEPPWPWWKAAVVYHIYVRSFRDTTGTGVGDLAGVTEKLDYLGPEGLGVDAIWLSPIYASPDLDFGYDVSDYEAVQPEFGTLDDVDTLIGRARDLGMRVLLDFVPNHTSTRHRWFADHPDWYLWRDPAPEGGPPNNWASTFGGSAWEFDAARNQYYLHSFLPEQADVEWRNAELRSAMLDSMRFWLDRGVAGFRLDVVDRLMKDAALRDNPLRPGVDPALLEKFPYAALAPEHTENCSDLPEALRAIRKTADAFGGDRVLIGETFPEAAAHVRSYYGTPEAQALHLAFNYKRSVADIGWSAEAWRKTLARQAAELPTHAWPCTALSNHDRPRHASRHDPTGEHPERVRSAAVLELTLRGTPVLYMGSEIGMRDVEIPPKAVHDPVEAAYPGFGRDPERTPMRWTAGPGVGFTSGAPWLPDGGDLPGMDVESQRRDPDSVWNLYRDLLRLREARPSLRRGTQRFPSIDATDPDVLVFVREYEGERTGVAVNMGAKAALPNAIAGGEVLAGELLDGKTIAPDAAIIVDLD